MKKLSLLILCLTACEPSLPSPGPGDGGETDGGVPPRVTVRTEGNHSVGRVIAQDAKTFTGLDLDTSSEVTFEPPVWDLAFQRFHIRSRGGASGDGGVQVAPITDAGFDAVTQAPADGWLEDQPDGPQDENLEIDTVFETAAPWYSYDVMTHVLTPTPTVYVVKTDRGNFFKVQVDNYYDSAGTPADLTLRFAPVAPPP